MLLRKALKINLVISIALLWTLVFNLYANKIAKAASNTYYISQNGNDNNSGASPSSAWKSITKVNSVIFTPGDQILFEGGGTFEGGMYFDSKDIGTSLLPIKISSYGTGSATIIPSGETSGFFAYNTSGFNIVNISFKGSSGNTGNGINFYTDLPNNAKLPYIHIENVEASGFGKNGILVGGWNGTTGYKDVNISKVKSHDNLYTGISTYGQLPNSNENVYVGYSQAYNSIGIKGAGRNTGNGIALGSVKSGVVERSVAYNNGALCDAPEGPVGIWTYDSSDITIQYNESYNNKTGGKADGDGFDLDQNVSDSVLQYNYSHENDGAGFLIAHGPDNTNHKNNIIRYNISRNDGRKNNYAGLAIWGRTLNAEIYNNTISTSPSNSGTPRIFSLANWTIENQDVQSVHFRNNIFYSSNVSVGGEATLGQLSGGSDILFQGNNYYSEGGAFKFIWGSQTFSGVDEFRNKSGQEKLTGSSTGFGLNPQFLDSVSSNSTGYKLKSLSPMIDAGLDLQRVFNLNPGQTDLFGVNIPQSKGYDIGASEYINSVATITNTPAITNVNTPSPTFGTPTPIINCLLKKQGDSDCNGIVDLIDFNVFREEFILYRAGKVSDVAFNADFDGNRAIDLLDFELFRQGFLANR